MAALAVRLRAGDALLEAARFAVGAASVSVTRAGTMLSFASEAEAAALAAGI
ncbi:MAG: hypothetical protein M3312_00965 [Actinomycetota bacterium]|nr:hypothetical protein [Actinomycetota bacterium]